jgi:hypothetical protein
MSKLNELQSAYKIIKKDYKSCKKDVSKLHQTVIRFNNDIEDLKGEILKAEKYLNLETSEEQIFQLIVYRPKVRIKKKKQTIIQQSDFIDYQPFENEILVRNKNECKDFIDLAKKELKKWEDARNQFREEYDLARNYLNKIGTEHFLLKQKIDETLTGIITKSKTTYSTKKNEGLDNRELVKIYISLWLKIYPEKIKLDDLVEKKGSKPTWSRRLNAENFLYQIMSGIEQKLKKRITTDEKEKLDELKIEIVTKITSIKKKKITKNKEVPSPNFDNYTEKKSTNELKNSVDEFIDNISLD